MAGDGQSLYTAPHHLSSPLPASLRLSLWGQENINQVVSLNWRHTASLLNALTVKRCRVEVRNVHVEICKTRNRKEYSPPPFSTPPPFLSLLGEAPEPLFILRGDKYNQGAKRDAAKMFSISLQVVS